MWIWCLVQTHVYTGKQSRATASEKWLQSLFLQQSLLKKSRVTNRTKTGEWNQEGRCYLHCLEKTLFRSSRVVKLSERKLHLFDQKYRNIVKYYSNLKWKLFSNWIYFNGKAEFTLLWKPWFVQDSLMNRKFKRTAFIWNNIIIVFTVTFDQLNSSLLNKSIDLKNLVNMNGMLII